MAETQRGLLLDFDGTLADTLPHLCRSFRFALEPFVQRQPTDAEIIATFGPPERENLRQLLGNPTIGKPGALAHLDAAEERYHQHYQGKHDAVRVYSGIPEALALALKKGWRVGVFTGKSRRSATFALEHLGLSKYVECLIGGTDVVRPKPDPEGVNRAAELLQLQPERIVLVGDSVGDIQAGKAAGAKTAAALWGAFDPKATLAAGPDLVLEKVADLRRIIEDE